MTRTLFGGSPADVLVQRTADDGDLAPLANTSLTAWTAPDGAQLTDLQTPSGTASTQVTTDAFGRVMFYGPDPYPASVWVKDPDGNFWRIDPADLASRLAATWDTLFGRPAVVAAGADQAAARASIAAGVDTVMTSTEATAGTGTSPRQITPAVLKAGVLAFGGNTVTMNPPWDGVGTAPTRPTLPAGFVYRFRQPVAPAVDATHAQVGDEWILT